MTPGSLPECTSPMMTRHVETVASAITPRLLDVVALLADVPAHSLVRGQVGTVVELLNGAYEVEFSDEEGYTYAELGLAPDQLLVLHHRPQRLNKGYRGERIRSDYARFQRPRRATDHPRPSHFGRARRQPDRQRYDSRTDRRRAVRSGRGRRSPSARLRSGSCARRGSPVTRLNAEGCRLKSRGIQRVGRFCFLASASFW
jgi:hypothetical protein